jgi:hypothetical protein
MSLTELVCEDAPNIPTAPTPESEAKQQPEWAHYYYEDVLDIANQTRSVMLAVLVDVRHLYYKAWDKSKPFKFSNAMIKRLNFDRRSKEETQKKITKSRQNCCYPKEGTRSFGYNPAAMVVTTSTCTLDGH